MSWNVKCSAVTVGHGGCLSKCRHAAKRMVNGKPVCDKHDPATLAKEKKNTSHETFQARMNGPKYKSALARIANDDLSLPECRQLARETIGEQP